MRLNKKDSTLYITATCLVLVFIASGLFIWLAPLLSRVLVLSDNLLMQEPYRICQVALKPVDCGSKVTTLQLPQASSEM